MTYDPSPVSELLDLVEETFDAWMYLLESAPEGKVEHPGVSGDWSLKDIIAHITWHEEQMVKVMEARTLIGSEWWELPTHERNARVYEEYQSAPLTDVLDHAVDVHQRLIHWIKALSDEELNEPGQFEAMPEDWLFGDILAQNTYMHYGDHAASVSRWIEDAKIR